MDIKHIMKNMTQIFILFGWTNKFFYEEIFSKIDYDLKILWELVTLRE